MHMQLICAPRWMTESNNNQLLLSQCNPFLSNDHQKRRALQHFSLLFKSVKDSFLLPFTQNCAWNDLRNDIEVWPNNFMASNVFGIPFCFSSCSTIFGLRTWWFFTFDDPEMCVAPPATPGKQWPLWHVLCYVWPGIQVSLIQKVGLTDSQKNWGLFSIYVAFRIAFCP